MDEVGDSTDKDAAAAAHRLEQNNSLFAHRIYFEGVEMPNGARVIEHLGLYNNLPEISQETTDWLWRFTICVGRTRVDSSTTIIRACRETLSLLQLHRAHLKVHFPKHFSGEPLPGFFDEWVWSLEHMETVAKGREMCEWTAPLIPSDPHYGQSSEKIRDEYEKGMAILLQKARPRKWWRFWRPKNQNIFTTKERGSAETDTERKAGGER